MRHHDQVIVNHEGTEVYGGANCPYCGTRSQLYQHGPWIMAARNCKHVNMAVDAGRFQVAIHFEGTTQERGL